MNQQGLNLMNGIAFEMNQLALLKIIKMNFFRELIRSSFRILI